MLRLKGIKVTISFKRRQAHASAGGRVRKFFNLSLTWCVTSSRNGLGLYNNEQLSTSTTYAFIAHSTRILSQQIPFQPGPKMRGIMERSIRVESELSKLIGLRVASRKRT